MRAHSLASSEQDEQPKSAVATYNRHNLSPNVRKDTGHRDAGAVWPEAPDPWEARVARTLDAGRTCSWAVEAGEGRGMTLKAVGGGARVCNYAWAGWTMAATFPRARRQRQQRRHLRPSESPPTRRGRCRRRRSSSHDLRSPDERSAPAHHQRKQLFQCSCPLGGRRRLARRYPPRGTDPRASARWGGR